MAAAITEAIKTIAEAERILELARVEDDSFFGEWQVGSADISAHDQIALDELRSRYLYQRSEGQLLEGTVTLLLASPLLAIAGFYDPPFKVKAEESIQLTIEDSEEILRGRIDVLVLKNRLWVVILESKKTALSAWAALPQTLAYLKATPQPDQPSFGLITNGDDMIFIKLLTNQYALSRVFSPLVSKQELHSVLQVLKQIGGIVQ